MKILLWYLRYRISKVRDYGAVLACVRGTTPRVPETNSERRGPDELGPVERNYCVAAVFMWKSAAKCEMILKKGVTF